jgi:hypothetical protein
VTTRWAQVRSSRTDRGTLCSRLMTAQRLPQRRASMPAEADPVSVVPQPCGPFQKAGSVSHRASRASPKARDSRRRPGVTPRIPSAAVPHPQHPTVHSADRRRILQKNRFNPQNRPGRVSGHSHVFHVSVSPLHRGGKFSTCPCLLSTVAASFQLVRVPASVPQVKNSWPRATTAHPSSP